MQQNEEVRMCVSCEVRTSSIYKKSKASPVIGRGVPCVFPTKYEHYLHIFYI
jgi:hypothetical protein